MLQALAFLIGLAASFAIVALATALYAVYLLLIPGPKGHLSRAFQRTLRGADVQKAKEEFSRRLEALTFVVDSQESDRITATRPKRPIRLRSYEDHGCESFKLIADVRFTTGKLGDVNVDLVLKAGEWIIKDDFETLYMEKLGRFLIAESFDSNEAPVVMRSSSNEGVIFTSGLLGVGLVCLLFTPYWPEGYGLQACVLHTIGWLGFWVAYISRGTQTVAKTYPTRIRRSLLAPAAIGLTLITSIILHFRWEETHLLATLLYTLAAAFPWQLTDALDKLATDSANEHLRL